MTDLKELEKRDLGGGIVLRKVLPVGGVWDEPVPKGRRGSPSPFYIVTLLWEGQRWPPGDPREGQFMEPSGIQEARIYPPRPEDGPDGLGWVVTDCPGDAGRQGYFSTLETALEAVVADLRTYDASRRLGHA